MTRRPPGPRIAPLGRRVTDDGGGVDAGGTTARGGARGRRGRDALGRAIRRLADAPDMGRAAAVVAEGAAWLLGAERALVVQLEAGGARVTCSVGGALAPAGQAVIAHGALAEALAEGRAGSSRASGVAEVVAPITVAGRRWGALAAWGPAERMPADAPELLAPFADLVSLAAATHEHRAVLASLAGTDPLTGLGNRRTFDALLGAEVERAQRHDDLLSLVLLDIDHFKRVNDAFGHQAGDRALVEVGRRLVGIARRGEAVSRIGGEEFAWILPRTGAAGAEAAARRALAALSGAPIEGVGRLTASAGVCELASAGGAEGMVRLADRMLYVAKAGGRDAVRRFAPGPELATAG